MPKKINLNPNSSFGGYCLIEENNPAIDTIDQNKQLPTHQRNNTKLNPNHSTLAYLEIDNHNPAGSGYVTPSYLKAIRPQSIKLANIHYPDAIINDSRLNQIYTNTLNQKEHSQLIAGFGVRAKSHPDRSKLVGTIDQAFIDNSAVLPKDFDFAMWNCAYPDQQTDHLNSNEWLTLTNLCSANTKAATINKQGDIELKLYLPDILAYLEIESAQQHMINTELPMRLDTVIISPDLQKVNLVWRAMVIADYCPKHATLKVMDWVEKQKLSELYFGQGLDIVRPYEM